MNDWILVLIKNSRLQASKVSKLNLATELFASKFSLWISIFKLTRIKIKLLGGVASV